MSIKGSIGAFFRSRRPVVTEDRVERVIERMPRRRGPYPKCWSDEEVRRAVVEYALQDSRPTLDSVKSALLQRFGAERTPSRSALARLTGCIDDLRVAGKLE